MPIHVHQSKDLTFEIEVVGVPLEAAGAATLFVAFITQTTAVGRHPVVHRRSGLREVYGPTAAWALENARHLVDSGGWELEEKLTPARTTRLRRAG